MRPLLPDPRWHSCNRAGRSPTAKTWHSTGEPHPEVCLRMYGYFKQNAGIEKKCFA